MKFSTLAPKRPRTWVLLCGGGGPVGVKTPLAYCGHEASIQIQVLENFFLLFVPPDQWWGPPVPSRGIQDPPPYGAPPVRTLLSSALQGLG